MKRGVELLKGQQGAIADRVVALGNNVLSRSNTDAGYIALKIGTGPYSDAVAVRTDGVLFHIRSEDTLNRARAAGFDPKPVDPSGLSNPARYKFSGLKLVDIDKNEPLFKEIVEDSVRTIISRRPKGK